MSEFSRAISVLFGSMLIAALVACSANPKRSASRVLPANAPPVPLRVSDDHLLVPAIINGQAMSLVLDTGASHIVLTPAAAERVGLKKTDDARFRTFGPDVQSVRSGVIDQMNVGSAHAENVRAFIIPVPERFNADGMLGIAFLGQFPFQLDYVNHSLCFALPEQTSVDHAVTIDIDDRMVVEAEVDGIPARMLVDTGAAVDILLNSWFVEQHKLRERFPRRVSLVTGGNLLGSMHGEVTRLPSFQLGGHLLTNLYAEFQTSPSESSGALAGFIGAGTLRRFNIMIDPGSKRLWLAPNDNFNSDRPPLSALRTGAAWMPRASDWLVLDVMPHTPATEAGILANDRLLEVDGIPVTSLTTPEIKQRFRAAPGTRVRLRLQSDNQPSRETVLTLRDIL
jgi:clan AA aspartic protease (TIGR02281 family)